jgi:hypothetical protein
MAHRDERWIWVQRCSLTGETDDVLLTDKEKLDIEARPSFTGWSDGELREIAGVAS